MNINIELLDYNDLQEGQTRQGNCPVCGKRKFYVTRKQGRLAYICHRASCGLDPGYAGDDRYAGAVIRSTPANLPPRKRWDGCFFPCTEEDVSYFDERFGINLYGDRGYWVRMTEGDCYAFPLYGIYDEDRGVVIRQPTWGGYPPCPREGDGGKAKSLTFLEGDAIKAGWYHAKDKDTVVVVEDQVSAMRIASMGYTAYALLGTYFSDDNYRDLIQFNPNASIHLALDADAYDKAIKITRKYRGGFKYWILCNLSRDPKDYNLNEELEKDLRI